jgi:ribosome modulation factor
MKTLKRNKSIRAYAKGYQSGVCGKTKDFCPYSYGDVRQAWLTGWREGRTDNWDSLIGVSGLHKQAMIRGLAHQHI